MLGYYASPAGTSSFIFQLYFSALFFNIPLHFPSPQGARVCATADPAGPFAIKKLLVSN
jgi:hypothetical protein